MENMGKRPFFWAAMAGFGKYHMGGYGRIGVYRVYRPMEASCRKRRTQIITMQSYQNITTIFQKNNSNNLTSVTKEMCPHVSSMICMSVLCAEVVLIHGHRALSRT